MSKQDHKDFFISYNGADQRWAEWIAWQLEEASYAVILQAWDFLPGSNFVVQMDRALTLAPRMIAVLSPQYLRALYTQPEWAAAFRHDPKGEQSLLIPVRVQACEVTGLLGQIVYVDLVGRDEATARQSLLAAVRHERAKPAQAPAFPQTIEHSISKQLNFPGDLPPIWKMPHQRDPLFLGREQLLQELHTTLTADHTVLLFEPAHERESGPGTSGATETAVEYTYRYRSDYQVVAWIQADSREAFRSDLLSLAAPLHLSQGNLSDQDPFTAVIQWLRTHHHWLLVLDQVQEKEVLAPLIPLPGQGHLLMITSTRSLGSLAPLIELTQVPQEEQTVLTQLSQVVGAALQGPQGRMPLGLEPITIGRASTNQVVLRDPSVSSRHAIIVLKDRGYWITDTGSTNGTLLNQQRLVPQVPSQLHPGDRIRFGDVSYTYEVLDCSSRFPVSSFSSEQGNTSAGASQPSSPVIERPRQDHVGQHFGNYRLSRLLGQGGFAEVYLGEHIFLDTQTAIKVLHTQLVGQDVEQFRQEARTIARLEHPHIVRLLDFGIEGSTPYLIMSYAPNGTMRQRYPKGTRLPLQQVVFYVKQIAQALQYAHEHKIIHRDIKPENMLFGPDDQVVLSDFGIALVTQSSRYQQPNDMAGTIAYMAPEQIEAHPRPASDQYSLGIVVYEWLCGERPFHGSFTEIAVKHQLVAPASLREKVPSLSAEVEQVVMTALAKDPKARFGSIRAFATALEQASQAASSHPVVLPTQIPLASEPAQPTDEERATPPGQAFLPTPVVTAPSQPAVLPETTPSPRQAGEAGEASVEAVSSSPATGVPSIAEESLAREPAQLIDEERARQAEEGRRRQAEENRRRQAEEERLRKSEALPSDVRLSEAVAPPSSSIEPIVQVSPSTQSVEPLVAATSSPLAPALPPATTESEPYVPQLSKRRLSRRTVIVVGLAGLTGLAVAGSGLTWLALTQRPQVTSPAPQPTATPTLLYTYRGHSYWVNTVAWSPDGKRIASGSYDGTVQVWNAADGGNVYTYHGHSNSVNTVAWSPDGKRIASGSSYGTVQVWNAADGSHTYTFSPSDNFATVTSVAWSPDGKRIASSSASWDNNVQVWNAVDGGNVYTYRGHHYSSDGVNTVAWSPDGKRIASGSSDGTVQVWNAADGGNVYTYRGHSATVTSVAWSPDGKRIASGSGDNTVQVWNAVDGGNVYTYRGHSATVTSVAWSPDGKRIASGSGDNTVQVWNAVDGGNVYTYRGLTGEKYSVTSVAWSPHGKRIASGSGDNTVKVWQVT